MRISHPRLALLVTGLLAGGTTAALAFAAPAAATGDHGNECTTVGHGVTTDIAIVPAATVELLSDGVKISTPDTPAKATWKSGPVDVKLTDLTAGEYTTYKFDTAAPAALPAFHLYLKTADNKTATIVYEPYYQIAGNPDKDTWKTWNVLAGKWWTSSSNLTGVTPEGGGSYAGNKTLAYIAEKNPGVKVVAYGWGQGTYNAGAVAKLGELKFDAKGVNCVKHQWSTRYKPSPSMSKSASPSPTPTKTTTATATGTHTATPSVTATALPLTGPSGTGGIVLLGVALVVLGAALVGGVAYARRRRGDVEFTI